MSLSFQDFDEFTWAYITAALWSSNGPEFGPCPCCGKVALLDRLPEKEFEQEEMCSGPECGTREGDTEPLDSNYSPDDLAPETLAECEALRAASEEWFRAYQLTGRRGRQVRHR